MTSHDPSPAASIITIGVGLHTFLKRWTTLALMVLFVMLNFTSSGGIFRPELQNGFFGSLHAFWNGGGFVEGVRDLLYFDSGAGFAGRLVSLVVWLAVGLLVLTVAAIAEHRRSTATARTLPQRGEQVTLTVTRTALAESEEAEEEIEESVGV